jgi:hypothetical protein
LKSNSCIEENKNELALQIKILDKKCSEWKKCDNKNFDKLEKIFDFDSKIWWVCKKGIDDSNYKWEFYNFKTGEEVTKNWKYIDNYKFLANWKWRITLSVKDNCWNKWETSLDLYINNNLEEEKNWESLWVEIDATPLYWKKDLKVDLKWKVEWWDWNYTYEWDYWDWTSWRWKDSNHIYSKPWTYTVKLKITDWDWKVWYSTVTIVVTEKEDKNWDSLWTEIDATPLFWEEDLDVNFEWKVEWWDGDYTYEWNYWDWTIWTWKTPNHIYRESWTYVVKLKITDWEWKIWYSTITIVVTEKEEENWLNVQVEVDKIIWNYDLKVNFDWIINWWNWPYKYEWNFWDWTKWNWKTLSHTYTEPWVYEVILIVTDKDWNIWKSTVIIKVLNFDSCILDSDWDWVVDCKDILPQVPWKIINDWAPILDNICKIDNECQKWEKCLIKKGDIWVCLPKKTNLNSCLQEWYNNFIIWNTVCDSCPCDLKLDFMAILRKCDLVFPAITSPDSKNIYWKWSVYKIQ